jgi:hypothetical protein
MASSNNQMTLTVWDSAGDVFDYTQLKNNFVKIAAHDHTTGKGKQIPSGGIASNAITSNHIKNGQVNNDKIANLTIQGGESGKIAQGAITSYNIASHTIGVDQLDSTVTQMAIPTYTETDQLPSVSGNADAGTEVYLKANDDYDRWHLRFNGSTTSPLWRFLGGPPAAVYQTSDHIMTSGTNATNGNIEIVNEMNLLNLLPGKYQVTFNAFLDFAYQSNSFTEFRLYLYDANTQLSDTVLATPIGENTQLSLPVSRTVVVQSSSNIQLRLRAKTKYKQSSTDSYVKRASISAIPLWLYPSNL